MRDIDWCQLEWSTTSQFKFKTRKSVHNLTGFLDLAGNALFQSPKENSISVYKAFVNTDSGRTRLENRLVSTRMVYDIQFKFNLGKMCII